MRETMLRGSVDSGSRARRVSSRWNLIRLVAGCVVACAASLAAAGDAPPLAIKGYDPVAYFTVGTPTRGLQEFELEWDEQRYRFSSAGHRALFKADPVHYAPQFADYCAMALSKGELVEANPENWAIADGKLYIFGKQMGPALFRQDVGGTVAKAERNRALTRKPGGDK